MARRWKFETNVEGLDLKGLEKVKQVLEEYKNHEVKVGVLGGNYPDGTPIAEVAQIHEFGVMSERTFKYKGETVTVKGIPQRSFLRVPLKKFALNKLNKAYFEDKILSECEAGIFTGSVLETIGQEVQGYIKDEFVQNNWIPNISKKYISLKGSDKPLWDTGLLVNSINYEVVKKGQ